MQSDWLSSLLVDPISPTGVLIRAAGLRAIWHESSYPSPETKPMAFQRQKKEAGGYTRKQRSRRRTTFNRWTNGRHYCGTCVYGPRTRKHMFHQQTCLEAANVALPTDEHDDLNSIGLGSVGEHKKVTTSPASGDVSHVFAENERNRIIQWIS